MDGPPSDEICPICRDGFDLPCRSNCSHWFCGLLVMFDKFMYSQSACRGHCFLQLWNNGPTLRPCQCPICRGFITLLIPTDAMVQGHQKAESDQVHEIILIYNRLFSGEPSSLLQKLRDLPFLIQRLSRELMHPQRSLPLVSRVQISFAMMLVAAYVLSPTDFLSEEAYGFVGLLDDLLVVLAFFMLIVIIYCRVLFRHLHV